MNDQDEFQFRPLTEGLGFHRKSSEPSSGEFSFHSPFPSEPETTSTLLPRKSKGQINKNSLSLDLSLETGRSTVPSADEASATVDEILKTLSQKKNLEILDKKKFLNETPPLQYVPSSFDISAGLLDGMLITATTLLCLILLIVITRVDLFNNLAHPDSQGFLYLSLATLVAGITWIYLVGTRVALGFTPGEWVFDQRLGKPEQLGSTEYTLKTIARTTILVATGLVLIPLFSFLFHRDFLGRALGLELMKQSRG